MDASGCSMRHVELHWFGHAQIRDLLPAYATALTLGQSAAAGFPQVAQHLEHCAECRSALEELLQLIEPLYDATLEPACDLPALDLSFLPSPAPPPVEQAAPHSAPQPFGTLSRLVLILDQQLESLRRQSSSGFGRSPLLRARGTPLIDYEPNPATTGGVSVSIQLYPGNATGLQRYDLQLALVLPEGTRAPNGIAVALQVDDQTWEETTDESGLFIFSQAVPLEATKLRITAEILP